MRHFPDDRKIQNDNILLCFAKFRVTVMNFIASIELRDASFAAPGFLYGLSVLAIMTNTFIDLDACHDQGPRITEFSRLHRIHSSSLAKRH